MRRAALLVALLAAACSSNPGTAGQPSARPVPSSVSPSPSVLLTPPHRPSPLRTVHSTPSPAARRTASATPRATVPSRTWALTITGYAFDPRTLVVRVGDRLRVTNLDPDAHTLTSRRRGAFDTGPLAQGRSVTLRLSRAGVFDFVCSRHPYMTGQLTVSG